MSKEAMKLALDALENHAPLTGKNAIIALREALASEAIEQPAQQGPASNCNECANADSWGMPDKPCCRACRDGSHWSPLNKTSINPNKPALAEPPAQRKPLSVEEMFEAIRPLYSSDKAAWLAVNHSKDEYRAIEAAHGIKENA